LRELDEAMEGHAAIDKACRDHLRWYNREHYHKNKDRKRENRRAYYKRWRASKTPAEWAAYLAHKRDLRRRRKEHEN